MHSASGKCLKNASESFELGLILQGIVTDWSDAEIRGLKTAVGKDMAEKLLKGCKVHWQRSCQRVAEKVLSSRDRLRERVFLQIASKIQILESSVTIIACFEALCGVRSVTELLQIVPNLCKADDAEFIDGNCDWSCAKHWAQWWTRCDHLKMLSKSFSNMDDDIWEQCPSSTNAVERRNRDCKSDTPQCLKLALIKVYKVDKVACLRHIAAKEGIVLSYRSRSEETRRATALKKREYRKKITPDKESDYGPPDRIDNFVPAGATACNLRKRKRDSAHPCNTLNAITVYNSVVQCFPNNHPEIVGKRARMKFEDEQGEDMWYEGVVSSYNVITGKYGVFFPSDGTTEETSYDDGDFELMDS